MRMWPIIKRLFLGIALILSAAAVLLISDRGQRQRNDGETKKTWNINLLDYVNVEDSDESLRGIVDGLRKSELVEGRDYSIKIRDAQGDMPTLNSLVDAALSDRADLIITLSTPTLQAAIAKAHYLPVVFTFVADPISAGVARSNTDHLPNVTGVSTGSADEELLVILRECIPHVRRIGTIFVPSEVNTVYHRNHLVMMAQKAGIEVVSVAANTSSDLPDAALALCNMKIDAVVQIAGNLTGIGFTSIARAARDARLPAFGFLSSQAQQGAAVVVARDYYNGGKRAAQLAVRVMRGESPASIPIEPLRQEKIIVNLPAARAVGLNIPESLLKKADKVITP